MLGKKKEKNFQWNQVRSSRNAWVLLTVVYRIAYCNTATNSTNKMTRRSYDNSFVRNGGMSRCAECLLSRSPQALAQGLLAKFRIENWMTSWIKLNMITAFMIDTFVNFSSSCSSTVRTGVRKKYRRFHCGSFSVQWRDLNIMNELRKKIRTNLVHLDPFPNPVHFKLPAYVRRSGCTKQFLEITIFGRVWLAGLMGSISSP